MRLLTVRHAVEGPNGYNFPGVQNFQVKTPEIGVTFNRRVANFQVVYAF